MPSTETVSPAVLNSWKEIASYVGRGVRTVQRWESDVGLPVHRPRGKSRSAVLAMTDEVDAWLRSAPTGAMGKGNDKQQSNNTALDLQDDFSQHNDLRRRCEHLCVVHGQVLSALVANVRNLQKTVEESRRARLMNLRKAASAASGGDAQIPVSSESLSG